jgi:hypothetical protein
MSLKHLALEIRDISHLYILARVGVLPRLQSLRVKSFAFDRNIFTRPLPPLRRLLLPELNKLSLSLEWVHKDVEWEIVEAITSVAVMPRLRHCTLVYSMKRCTDIRRIFASPLFGNDERHVRVRFRLSVMANKCICSFNDHRHSTVRSERHYEIYREYVSTTCLRQ